jgi:hypothetical protein
MYSYVIQPDGVNAVSNDRKRYNWPLIILFGGVCVWVVVEALAKM